MKTLTVTGTRRNLRAWLKRTLQGEDIGVMIDGSIHFSHGQSHSVVNLTGICIAASRRDLI